MFFKDYYLILGINKDSTIDEIVDVFHNLNESCVYKEDQKEAFIILSNPDLKQMYDVELDLYNKSGNYNDYAISNKKLKKEISAIQKRAAKNNRTTNRGIDGCLFVFAFIIIICIKMCANPLARELGRHDANREYNFKYK